MYIPDFVCEFIMTNIRIRCCGGMAVTKKRSIPSDPNPEVVVCTYDEFERFRIPSTLAESPTMLSLKLYSASPLPITVQSAALERSTVYGGAARKLECRLLLQAVAKNSHNRPAESALSASLPA